MRSGRNSSTAARRVLAEVPPALEELVARAVPPAQGFALVGETESDSRQSTTKRDGVLERTHAGLLLQEEDAHQRRLITRAGFPTAMVFASSSPATTTLPAPTMHPSPMRAPGRMQVPMPIQQSEPISTGCFVQP